VLLQDKVKIIRYLIIILLLLTAFSCKKQEDNRRSNTDNTKQKQDSTYNEKIYLYEDNEFVQRIKVKKINDKSISFVLISKNKIKKLSNTISGVAKLNEGSGENDNDEEGNAYFVNEYMYDTDNCWLAFRIDVDTKSLMRIKEADCDKLRNPDCPFASIATLKLKGQ
jgi:hypothetical protein